LRLKKQPILHKKPQKIFQYWKKTGHMNGTGNVICLVNDMIPAERKNVYVPVMLI